MVRLHGHVAGNGGYSQGDTYGRGWSPPTRRQPDQTHRLDPVYRRGFEWLFTQSENSSQATLLGLKFSEPTLLSKAQLTDLATAIARDEMEFRAVLERAKQVQAVTSEGEQPVV